MRIYETLLYEKIGEKVLNALRFCKEEFIEDADTKAIDMLEEIRRILADDKISEHEMVDKI